MVRSLQDILDAMDAARPYVESGSAVPSLSYEEGVLEALCWVAEETDQHPIFADELDVDGELPVRG